VAVSITTALYVLFSRIATHLTINPDLNRLVVPLTCQLAAILLAASTSYLLNGVFTWPRAQSNATADLAQVEEI
jgi:putative flippase GtrA